MCNPFVIGVTGAVGAGKSTVLRWLVDLDVPALDADKVVHGLLDDDPETRARVAERFPESRHPDGRIDRSALGRRVFDDPAALRELEALLHPRVIEVFRAWTAAAEAPIVAVEAVKLIESGMHRECAETWVVQAAASARRARLAERGWTVEEIDRRMAAAPAPARHIAAASRIIDNGGPSAATERQLDRALRDVRRRIDVEDRT